MAIMLINVDWIGVLRDLPASKVNASLGGNGTVASSRSTSKRKARQLEEDASDEDDWDAVRINGVDNATTATTTEKEDRDYSVIDPQLSDVAGLVHGIGMASSIPGIEDLVDPLQYDDQATLSTETDPLTSLSPNDFIFKFSKINVVYHSQPTAYNVDRGGSREEPHRFKKPCPNAVNGCSKLLETDEQIRYTCCIASQPRLQIIRQLSLQRQSLSRVLYARCVGSEARRSVLFRFTCCTMTNHGCPSSAMLLVVDPRLTSKMRTPEMLTMTVRMGVIRRSLVLSRTAKRQLAGSCFSAGTRSNNTLVNMASRERKPLNTFQRE